MIDGIKALTETPARSIRTVKPPLEQDYMVDRNYSVNKYLRSLGLPNRTTPADQVWLIDCPRCGAASLYDNSRSDRCKACCYYNLADHAKDAYTLAEYAQRVTHEVIRKCQMGNVSSPA